MLNLWTEFPQRGTHRIKIYVDNTGFEVVFLPETKSGKTEAWAPNFATAERFVSMAQYYLEDHKSTVARVDNAAPPRQLWLQLSANGALVRIRLVNGPGDYFKAQVTEDELRNLVDSLKFYFRNG